MHFILHVHTRLKQSLVPQLQCVCLHISSCNQFLMMRYLRTDLYTLSMGVSLLFFPSYHLLVSIEIHLNYGGSLWGLV